MFEYMSTNMNFFHGFGMLIFWAIIIFLIFSLFSKKEKLNKDDALDTLKKRLAKGEISQEEFTSIKKLLEENS